MSSYCEGTDLKKSTSTTSESESLGWYKERLDCLGRRWGDPGRSELRKFQTKRQEVQKPYPGRTDKHGKQMGARGGWGAVSKGEEQLEEPQDDIWDQGFMQFRVMFQHYRHIILIYDINYIIFQIIKIILKNPKPSPFLNIFTTHKMLRYFKKMKFPSRKKTQKFLEPWSFSHRILFLNDIWEDLLFFMIYGLGLKYFSLISIFPKFTILFMWSYHYEYDFVSHK